MQAPSGPDIQRDPPSVRASIAEPEKNQRANKRDGLLPAPKKPKLSSSVAGQGQFKSKKHKKKFKVNKSQRNKPYASQISSWSNQSRHPSADRNQASATYSSTASTFNSVPSIFPTATSVAANFSQFGSSKSSSDFGIASSNSSFSASSGPAPNLGQFGSSLSHSDFSSLAHSQLGPNPSGSDFNSLTSMLQFSVMSLDRAMHRDASPWKNNTNGNGSESFTNDSFRDYNQFNNPQGGGLYTDFSQAWPDPRGPVLFKNDHNPYQWQNGPQNWHQDGGSRNLYGRDGPQNRNFQSKHFHDRQNQSRFNRPGWSSWGPDEHDQQYDSEFLRPQSGASSSKNQSRPSRSHNRWNEEGEQSSSDKAVRNQWQALSKQFSSIRFHTEGAMHSQELSDGSHPQAADSSGLEDSGSSGGAGRKRPRSFDRVVQLSKSSRAEKYVFQDLDTHRPNSSRALSVSILNRTEIKNPDSTSKQKKVPKPSSLISKRNKPAIASGVKPAELSNKKKQSALKQKATMSSSVSGSKATVGAASASEADEANPGDEGVLERAERMCKELREKRKQAVPSRASMSAQRVGALRSVVLNTSDRRFNLAHKSFLRGYMSDSSSTTDKATTGDGTTGSAAQKKRPSGVDSESETFTRSLGSASGADTATSSSSTAKSSKAQGSDIERIRQSIESSVMAGKRPGRTSIRERSLSGSRSPGTTVPSLATSSVTASSSNSSTLPLSKDAMVKLVNAPQSRTQRLQLARILRQHSATTVLRPRRIQLDGLYDNDGDDGDSIGDVLKNISGLEKIGECAELRNIKLEDLTYEDKQQIARMIEEADTTGRLSSTEVIDLSNESIAPQPTYTPYSIAGNLTPSSERINPETTESSAAKSHQGSSLRVQAPSPTPSRPLSLDDLDMEDRSSSRQKDPSYVISFPISSSLTVTSSRSRSPSRTSLGEAASIFRKPAQTRSSSPARASARSGDRSDVAVGGDVNASGHQASGSAVGNQAYGPSAPAPMDVSEGPSSNLPPCPPSSQESGVLYEVMGLSKRQDFVLSEMRDIDNELCSMYKNLIEVVARMSGLQRRRVQLQTEGEYLSKRRSDLLHGLFPDSAVSLDNGPFSSAQRERQPSASSELGTNAMSEQVSVETSAQRADRMSTDRDGDQPQQEAPSDSSVPSWISAVSSSRSVFPERGGVEKRQETTTTTTTSTPTHTASATASDRGADIGLSGSASSSVKSAVSSASRSRSFSFNKDVLKSKPTPQAPNAMPASSEAGERAGRVMLSISGAVDSGADKDVSSVSSASTEAGQSIAKNKSGADTSSGIGSSVSAHSNLRKSMGSPASDAGSSHQNLSSSIQSSQEQSESASAQPATESSSRLVIHSFASPKPSSVKNVANPNVVQSTSPTVNVAYLGALSSDLVQQIVRNLPLTSQLGEVNKPSMFVVRQENPVTNMTTKTHSVSVDSSTAGHSRTRTSSAHSVSSDLSSGEPSAIPPLPLCGGDTDKTGSKTTTPRSESDSHSVTSGTSLGEQIKLLSERNSFSQDTPPNLSSLSTNVGEDGRFSDMPECSVLLERLEMDKITIIPDPLNLRAADDEMDRRKKRKSRKDRDQSLQRRRRFVTDSSSEEGEDGEITPVGEGGLSPASSSSQEVKPSVEKMEADWGSEGEDMNSTLVGSQEGLSEEEEEVNTQVDSTHTAAACPVSPSRLKLHPENLKAFRATIQRNMNPSPTGETPCTPAHDDDADQAASAEEGRAAAPAGKEGLKIKGPCAPVMGLCVHNNLLYACFQRMGVCSYTMTGQLSVEYPQLDAHCFTITPVGSGSQHHLAVGCADRLTFLSITDQSLVSSLDTVVKVMCVLVIDTSLFAGLDSGIVVVVSLTTLQETRRFQASDWAIQSMAWTREGSTRLLTIASQDANIHVIDAGIGLPVRIISGHSKTAFALHMLDHMVLSGSGDRKVMAHNVHNAALMWELHDHKGIITSISVDNGLLFTAGYDKVIRCYDLKSRKLLHLMYGAGKCVIMKMAVHNSVLYTGNRDGEIEAIDLRDMGNFACECVSCPLVYGLREHLLHHLVTDHLKPNTPALRCPWADCPAMLNTCSAPWKAGEHLQKHINDRHQSASSGP